MPEYLAPGVYVEETSFRAKSIEGVSTSTTAFVGPTRRGPVDEIPELITSFGDFERVYGGLAGVHTDINYIAHAVRAYFNEGGSRLYVSRVYTAPETDPGDDPAVRQGRAYSSPVATSDGGAQTARFEARFPGRAGNGAIALRVIETPATPQTMNSAAPGTLMRLGGGTPATSARLEGGTPTFGVPDGAELRLQVGGNPVNVTFSGQSAEAVGGEALVDPVDLGPDEAGRTLQVRINGGGTQQIVLTEGSYTPAQLASEVNTRLNRAYAELGPGGELVIGTERKGTGAAVRVFAAPAFGFPDEVSVGNPADPDTSNTVPDIGHITPADLDAILQPHGMRASLSPATGRLVLSTVATGPTATLQVLGGAGSAHLALGLSTEPEPVVGGEGGEVGFFLKSGSGWIGEDGADAPVDEDFADGDGAEFLTMAVQAQDADGSTNLFEDLGFDPSHPRWIGAVMSHTPSRRSDHLEYLYAFQSGGVGGFDLFHGLFDGAHGQTVLLENGDDGSAPTQAAYESALTPLEALEDISIVAAPGHTAFEDEWEGIQGAIIAHASRRRAYRIAVLDTPPEQNVGEARRVRSRIDSRYAAIYFPWVTVSNPLSRPGVARPPREINLPPSGFICGIYARNDVERGVHKAPANEVVRGALRFETDVNFAQQEVLNPIGVNCLRFFPGRGYRVWGARLASSDPEWKYVNVRRYFNYLERSIDQGTQWVVFEPNGERLWANVRETVSGFLYNEWRNGALLGTSPKEAYFVRCDRSTMTQNDLDNGRLICQVGVAVLKPAEFVIFQIGQKTADQRE